MTFLRKYINWQRFSWMHMHCQSLCITSWILCLSADAEMATVKEGLIKVKQNKKTIEERK